ncbi:NmrA-like family protein [Nitrosomonas communis]|uniref:NmrA-like family protein n=1 Tax=Nitrosomonas communis TaxID=44574 RepID=A0A1I4NF48_9PROT|nr:NmrA-like family protein [Nitrosomonas communis]
MSAEVVEENVDDKESLKKAFDGAYGAYCVETATGSTVHIQRVEDSNHQEVRPLLLL